MSALGKGCGWATAADSDWARGGERNVTTTMVDLSFVV
jgi:hypothetical protein